MPSDRVQAAVDELKAAMVAEGSDPGTVDAILAGILPGEHPVVGNYADLQQMGAGTEIPGAETEETDLSDMTKAELEAEAASRGVEVPSGATKAEILELLGG